MISIGIVVGIPFVSKKFRDKGWLNVELSTYWNIEFQWYINWSTLMSFHADVNFPPSDHPGATLVAGLLGQHLSITLYSSRHYT